MSEWEPATDAEAAMRDALRTDDQESYFRILAGVDLLLPVSTEAVAGTAPIGWGTWSTAGRTHVLAFTSDAALQSCLADYTGSARRVPYSELANTWPNLEWWLAVNPGLPIEGYLPAWFVAQLARGDLRLPTRGPGREAQTTSKIQELGAAALAAGRVGGESAVGGPTYEPEPVAAAAAPPPPPPVQPVPSAPVSAPPLPPVAPALAPIPPVGNTPPMGSGGLPVRTPSGTSPTPSPGLPAHNPAAPVSAPAGYPPSVAPVSGPAGYAPSVAPVSGPAGYPPSAAPAGPVAPPTRGGSGMATPGWDKPGMPFRPEEDPRGPLQDPRAPLPVRTPMANTPPVPEHVMPYNPAEAPVDPAWVGKQGTQPASAPPFGPSGGAVPASAPPFGSPVGPPPFGGPAGASSFGASSFGASSFGGPGGAPPAPAASGPSGALPRRQPGQSTGGGPTTSMPGFVPAASNAANTGGAAPIRPAAPPPGAPPPGAPASAPPSYGSPTPGFGGSTSSGGETAPAFGGSAPAFGGPSVQQPGPAPAFGGPAVQQPASSPVPGAGALGGALPRRQVTPPSERPTSMAAAAQALGARTPAEPPAWERQTSPPTGDRVGPSGPMPSITPRPETESPAATTMTNLLPPVIPGAAGADRGAAAFPPGAGHTVPAVPQAYAQPAPGPAYGLPPQGSPASAYATQAFPGPASATQVLPVATGGYPSTGGYTPPGASNMGVSGSATGARGPSGTDFVPANEVERELQDAADAGNTDVFLSTLLLAQVLVPVAGHSRPGSAPGESGFAFLPEEVDGEYYLIVFTSKDRLSDHFGEPTRTVGVRFYELIRNWPDPAWSFAVNPGTPVGAKYPGAQIIALANWATEAGLGAEPAETPASETQSAPVPAPQPASDEAQQATVMQKTISAEQVDYYLDRGYDRVAGFVHRASEVEHLRTPAELFGALGLYYDASPFQPDAKEAFVLRWPAYRPSLYRIPYGGQNEQALRAMDGWVIERPPFRGNGFAPGEGRDVIAEFKVDSVRLPHGAQLWCIDSAGAERMMAIFDADGPQWRRVGE